MTKINKITVCLRSVNEAIYTTTLHTVLNFGMVCKMYNIQLEVNIVPDRTSIHKYLKTCDRLVWIDYGVSIDSQSVTKFSIPFPEGVHVMMIPTVLPNINWDRFKMKTTMGTPEPANQRGLDFDTAVIETKEMFRGVSEFVKCSNDGRVVAFDSKPVLKKMTSSVSVNKMKEDGIKIGVLNGDSALCHYTYECIGNILETSGIVLSNE